MAALGELRRRGSHQKRKPSARRLRAPLAALAAALCEEGKAANSALRWAQKPFSYAVANPKVAVNIPRSAETDGRGYFEDRRPPSDCDPYVVISELTRSTFEDED